MAWEMQRHMHEYLAPSIAKAAEDSDMDYRDQLIEWYVEQRFGGKTLEELDEDEKSLVDITTFFIGDEQLVHAIKDHAKWVGSTTNGGFEFYLSEYSGGYGTSIPYCTEEQKLALLI